VLSLKRIISMENKFDIRLVDFDCTKDVNSFHFYPDRKFDAETMVIIYRKESFGNGGYLNFFYECDKRNIKVNAFCHHNFFPLASLVSHSCYTERMESFDFVRIRARKSEYGLLLPQFTKYRKELEIEHLLPVKYEQVNFLSEILEHPICQCDFGKWQNPCVTGHVHEKSVWLNYKIKDLNRVKELYEHFKDKPIYLSKQFFDHFNAIKDDLGSEQICVELKLRASPSAMIFFQGLNKESPLDNKIVNIDKQWTWEMMNKYKIHQSYLSFQFLLSVYKNWRYIALGGASNVMQAFYPINTMMFGDSHSTGDCPNTALLKVKLNKYLYNEEPLALGNMRDRNLEGQHEFIGAFNDLSSTHMNIARSKILSYF